MAQQLKRQIGRIWLDGKFLSSRDLERGLEEQKHTKELLGTVLVRMGVLKPEDVKIPLIVQENLGSIEDAVKNAAGERQLLGALLVRSGHINHHQLDRAIAEQRRSGEKIGDVFKRLGMLTDPQLNALLDFQHHQEVAHDTPLRLGELLVATGHITRSQLDDALHRQTRSNKKLGDVLVEAGYARPQSIKYGIRLQKMLLNAVLAAILSIGMSTGSEASSVGLQWDPNTEPDIAGYKVYYGEDVSTFAGSTPVNVQNQTTATISGLDPDKSYTFAVTAYNAAGEESSYSNVVNIAEQSSPTVAITSPENSSNVSGTVFISVSADDNVGVTKVEYYANNQLLATETSAPYVHSWDTSNLAAGAYTLMVKAYDAAGNVSQTSSSVSVVDDHIAPTVAFTSPANNSTVSGTVIIDVGASDNVGVSMVEFYCNGVLIYASNATPYSFNWDTLSVADGSYVLIAKAYDAAGNVVQSSNLTVSVNNAPLPAPVQVSGDINNDGKVSIADVLMALNITKGKITPTAAQLVSGDVAPVVDGVVRPDGIIDSNDVTVILGKVSGKNR